ncbi:MAG: hypothetical protein O7H41_03375 [Planctomycetota bacterium]|nr:hypothetical protein [Planctomycetota bacterium]
MTRFTPFVLFSIIFIGLLAPSSAQEVSPVYFNENILAVDFRNSPA